MYKNWPKDHKKKLIERIQEFFLNEHGEDIGEIAAETFLLFAVKEIGPFIYNEGVKDAKTLLQDRMMNVEEDLTSLERPINN